MSEMAKRVAGAIIDAGYNPATAENIARIAIEAMRDPDVAMRQLIDGRDEWWLDGFWEAMIDAALGN